MSSAKHDVEQLLNQLPDSCSLEEILYHLYVIDKVRRGLDDAVVNGSERSNCLEGAPESTPR